MRISRDIKNNKLQNRSCFKLRCTSSIGKVSLCIKNSKTYLRSKFEILVINRTRQSQGCACSLKGRIFS